MELAPVVGELGSMRGDGAEAVEFGGLSVVDVVTCGVRFLAFAGAEERERSESVAAEAMRDSSWRHLSRNPL